MKQSVTRKAKLVDAVVPVFTAPEGLPLPLASAFLLHLGDERILVTAAHVLDELSQGHLYVPGGREFWTVEGMSFSSAAPGGNRLADKIDLGIVVLTERLADDLERGGRWFIPTPLLLPNAPATPDYQYGFCGFPHRTTKRNPKLHKVRSSPEMYTGRCQPDSVYTRLLASRTTHVAVDFDHKKIANSSGTLVMPKDRRGTSGGPVFAYVNQPSNLQVPRLRIVGVAIEHHPECRTLLATKVDALITLIRKALPATAISVAPAIVVPTRRT